MRETVKIIGEKKSPIPSPFSPLLNSLSLLCVLFIHSLFCQRGHGTRVSTRGERRERERVSGESLNLSRARGGVFFVVVGGGGG